MNTHKNIVSGNLSGLGMLVVSGLVLLTLSVSVSADLTAYWNYDFSNYATEKVDPLFDTQHHWTSGGGSAACCTSRSSSRSRTPSSPSSVPTCAHGSPRAVRPAHPPPRRMP